MIFFKIFVVWFVARDRTISPADLQGILGMMAHDHRTGFRGFPSLPGGLFGSRGSSRFGRRQVCLPSASAAVGTLPPFEGAFINH